MKISTDGNLLPLLLPTTMTRNNWTTYRKPLMAPSGRLQTYTEQILNNFHQQEKEFIADLNTRLTALLEKCNYNQCCYIPINISVFIHAVKSSQFNHGHGSIQLV